MILKSKIHRGTPKRRVKRIEREGNGGSWVPLKPKFRNDSDEKELGIFWNWELDLEDALGGWIRVASRIQDSKLPLLLQSLDPLTSPFR